MHRLCSSAANKCLACDLPGMPCIGAHCEFECKFETGVREAAARDCSVLLFHEGCLTGYPMAEDLASIDWTAVSTEEDRVATLYDYFKSECCADIILQCCTPF